MSQIHAELTSFSDGTSILTVLLRHTDEAGRTRTARWSKTLPAEPLDIQALLAPFHAPGGVAAALLSLEDKNHHRLPQDEIQPALDRWVAQGGQVQRVRPDRKLKPQNIPIVDIDALLDRLGLNTPNPEII